MNGIRCAYARETDPSTPNGAFDFAHLTVPGLERAEVPRGPQGTLYGSDAIGGVIAFTTRRGEGPPAAELTIEGGSFSTFSQTLNVSGGTDLYNYNVTGSFFRTKGETITPERLRPDVLPEEDDGYKNGSGRARLGFTPGENVEINLFAHHIDTNADNDAGLEDPNSVGKTRQTFARAEGRLKSFDALLDQRLGYSVTLHHRKELDLPDPGSPDEASENRSKGRKVKVDWQADIHALEDNIFTVGAEWEREEFTNNGLFLDSFLGFETITRGNANEDDEAWALFVQDQFDLWNRVSGTVGARIDDHQSFGSEVTYRVAVAYDHHETGTRLRGTFGTGFKAPALFQRFGSSVFTIPALGVESPFFGNPDLDPETSEGWDIGFDQTFLDGRVVVGATYYRNDIDDLIAPTADFTSLINLNEIETWGVESFVSARPLDWLSIDFTYTYSRAEDPATGEEHFNRTPRHKIGSVITAEPLPGLELLADLLYVGSYIDRDRLTFSRITNGGFFRVDLAGSYEVMPGVEVRARIDNALDRDFEFPDGFLHPGIGVHAGVRARF